MDSSETLSRCRLALLGHPLLALDCEGVDLGRRGEISLIQIATREECFIIDVQGTSDLQRTFTWNTDVVAVVKPVLEDKKVCKIMHDCKADSDALYHLFGIKLQNVHDTQVAISPRVSGCLR